MIATLISFLLQELEHLISALIQARVHERRAREAQKAADHLGEAYNHNTAALYEGSQAQHEMANATQALAIVQREVGMEVALQSDSLDRLTEAVHRVAAAIEGYNERQHGPRIVDSVPPWGARPLSSTDTQIIAAWSED